MENVFKKAYPFYTKDVEDTFKFLENLYDALEKQYPSLSEDNSMHGSGIEKWLEIPVSAKWRVGITLRFDHDFQDGAPMVDVDVYCSEIPDKNDGMAYTNAPYGAPFRDDSLRNNYGPIRIRHIIMRSILTRYRKTARFTTYGGRYKYASTANSMIDDYAETIFGIISKIDAEVYPNSETKINKIRASYDGGCIEEDYED
jgi:hypothetical protein